MVEGLLVLPPDAHSEAGNRKDGSGNGISFDKVVFVEDTIKAEIQRETAYFGLYLYCGVCREKTQACLVFCLLPP